MNGSAQNCPGRGPLAGSIAGQSLHLALRTLGIAAFILLRLAEPLVRIGLTALGLLSILIAVFFRIVGATPHSPFWLLLGFGFSCGGVLLIYEWLLRLLSRGLSPIAR